MCILSLRACRCMQPTQPAACAQREAQALVLRTLVEAAQARGRAAVVLGDLNDYSDLYPDTDGNLPTSRTLRFLREGGPGGSGGGVQLDESARLLSESERYSYSDRNHPRSLLDHVLWDAQGVYVASAQVRHDLFAAGAVSDHWPLVLELRPGDEAPAAGDGRREGDVASVVAACVVGAVLLAALVVCWRVRRAHASRAYAPLRERSTHGMELQAGS